MPFDQTSASLTSLMAIYGALLSSLTFGWTLYRNVRDKAKVLLSCTVVRKTIKADGGLTFATPTVSFAGTGRQLYLYFEVVNIGRRPMLWKGIGGDYTQPTSSGGTRFVASTRELPKLLQEQESHAEHISLEDEFVRGNVKNVRIWDGGGNQWKLSRKQMRNLLREAQNYSELNQQQR